MKGVAMLKYFKYRKINKFFKNIISGLPVKYSSEEDVEKCMAVNSKGTEYIANICHELDIKMRNTKDF